MPETLHRHLVLFSRSLTIVVVSLASLMLGCDDRSAPSSLPPNDEEAEVYGLSLTGYKVAPLEQVDSNTANVFVFVRATCPVSNRYAPRLAAFKEEFGDSVKWWLVYPNPRATPESIHTHQVEYGLTQIESLRDTEHRLVTACQVTITPEVAVFDAAGTLVYHGRIDNRYVDFGKTRPQATSHELEDVLTALTEEKPVTTEHQPAVGCFIADLQ